MCKSVLPSPKASGPKRPCLRDITSSINEEEPLEADLQFDDFTIEHFDHHNEEETSYLAHEEEGQRRQTPAQGVRHASSRLMTNSNVKK